MNRENLLRAAEYIRAIPPDKFNMAVFRDPDHDSVWSCNSVGCVVGHTVVLDNPKNVPRYSDGKIKFYEWSMDFYGVTDAEWLWLFSGKWSITDNTISGAVKRIEWILDFGLPKNWESQMKGRSPL